MGRIPLLLVLALVACAKGSGDSADAKPDMPPPVDMMIDSNGCATQPCSILPQCGCSGGAMACDIDFADNNGTSCRSVNNPGKESTACNGPDKCDKGYVCLGGAAYATCKKYCMTNADCGSPRGRCGYDITANNMPIMGVPPACSSNCNPLPLTQQSECPSGYKCTPFTATHNAMPLKIVDCSPAGTGTQGSNCKAGNLGNEAMCAQGYTCTSTDAGATYVCRRVCNRTANTGCTTGTCIGYAMPHTIDVEYGVCN